MKPPKPRWRSTRSPDRFRPCALGIECLDFAVEAVQHIDHLALPFEVGGCRAHGAQTFGNRTARDLRLPAQQRRAHLVIRILLLPGELFVLLLRQGA